MARFYELRTNRPLYFTREYALTYSDADLPTHYAFKVGNPTDRIERLYQRILKEGRETILAERAQVRPVAAERIKAVIDALDAEGRWLEEGRLRNPADRHAPIVAQVILLPHLQPQSHPPVSIRGQSESAVMQADTGGVLGRRDKAGLSDRFSRPI